jgi:serine/threonine protein kinase
VIRCGARRFQARRAAGRGALAIARGIVEALEAAYERGIVHRDLEPESTRVPVDDGPVQVLDSQTLKRTCRMSPSATM